MTEFERCRPWIEAALEYSGGTHVYQDIVDAVTEGRMQLWPAPRGCAVTEIVLYPRKKVLHVFLAAGEMDQLFDGIDDATKWAKGQGCTAITLAGRLGWQRVLKPLGFVPTLVTMERNI
jgi:hypothetical protein